MSKNVRLRPISIDDTDIIIKWRNSDAVMHNFIYRIPLTRQQHLDWLKNKVNKKEVYQFIAEDNGVSFGTTYLKNIDTKNKKAEFGIFIGDELFRGGGYGSTIAKLTINFGFNELNLNKIYARVLAYNKASYYMFKKLGFNKDALLRKDVLIDEEYIDVYIVSILKSEWIE